MGLCKTANVDYALGGKILTFEFVNETGLLTVTSRRAVALALSLVNKAGMPVLSNSLITESQREFEGLGVLHSTNVDKLVNDVFKKVVRQAIDQVSVKLEVDVREVSVQTADAKVLHFAVDQQQQLALATTDIVAENRSGGAARAAARRRGTTAAGRRTAPSTASTPRAPRRPTWRARPARRAPRTPRSRSR